MPASALRTVALVLLGFGLAACKPEPPPTDEPPKPKAATAESTESRDAIRKPLDQAKAIEGAVLDAAEKHSYEIDAASN